MKQDAIHSAENEAGENADSHTDFEITVEMLDSWEQELDEFQLEIRNRLARISTPGTFDKRTHHDALHLADSIQKLLP